MSNQRFADAVATIAAELHGKSKDELAGIDVREHRRWRWVRNTAVTAISLLAVGMTIAAYEANRQRNRALEQRDRALAQETRALAVLAHQTSDSGDQPSAMLVALEAIREPGFGGIRPDSREAVTALRRGWMMNRETTLAGHGGAGLGRCVQSRRAARRYRL
jgi:hypothetical protein